MRKLLAIIGTLLIVIGGAALIVFIILPPAISSLDAVPIIKTTFQTLFCKPDELLIESRTKHRSSGYVQTFLEIDCINIIDQKRDVSGGAVVAGLVGFFVPFFIGLLMVIGASGMNMPTGTLKR